MTGCWLQTQRGAIVGGSEGMAAGARGGCDCFAAALPPHKQKFDL